MSRRIYIEVILKHKYQLTSIQLVKPVILRLILKTGENEQCF